MYLFIVVAFFFIGCSEESLLGSDLDQSEQAKTSMKMEKVEFTGTSIPVTAPEFEKITILPNGKEMIKGMTVQWYDQADDPRVTGDTFWTANQKSEVDGSFKYWGKAKLIVDNDGGTWEISWHGGTTSDGLIVAEGTGKGKSGDVKGLTAKWTYTMNPLDGFFYATKGYIQSKS